MVYKEVFFIAFRLINFAILIFLFTHVFFKYFYQDFKVQVKKRLDWWLVLRDNIMQMRIKQKELDAAIAHEQWKTERLLDNMARWRLWVQKEQQLRKERFDVLVNVVRIRRLQQEENYQETLFARSVIPNLFVQSRETLTKTYAEHEQKAFLFVDKTIKRIEGAHD